MAGAGADRDEPCAEQFGKLAIPATPAGRPGRPTGRRRPEATGGSPAARRGYFSVKTGLTVDPWTCAMVSGVGTPTWPVWSAGVNR